MPVAKSIIRSDFTRGWVPSHDAEKAPVNGYLVGDNLVLDDVGAPVLRGKIDAGDPVGSGPVLVIFDHYRDTDKYRVVHSGGDVFVNNVGQGIPASTEEPIAVGSQFGKAFICTGSSNNVYDPNINGCRPLGLQTPGAAPTISAESGTKFTLARCDAADSPAGAATEGVAALIAGHDGAAATATGITASTQLRAVYRKAYSSPQDFSGRPEDLVQFYLLVKEPRIFRSVSIQLDCGVSSDPLVLFSEDYFSHDFISGEDQTVSLPPESPSAEEYPTADEDDVARIFQIKADRRTRQVNQSQNNLQFGWNKLQVPRATMARIGNTPGQGFDKVQAVQIVITLQPIDITGVVPVYLVGVDDIEIIAGLGGFSGKYYSKYSAITEDSDGLYETESGLSPLSDFIEVDKGLLRVAGLGGGSKRRVYLIGGKLDGLYFAGDTTTSSIELTTSDIDILIADIRPGGGTVASVLGPPPTDVIAIVGPFKDRLIYLTEDYIVVSQRNRPETFDIRFKLRTGDTSHKTLFGIQAFGGIYIGTTKTIFRLDGDGDELPDGTISFRLTDLHEAEPPVSRAVAAEGNTFVYMGGTGPRLFNGSASQPLRGDTDLLWKDQVRYGTNGFQPTYQYPSISICHNLISFLPGVGSGRLIRYDQRLERWYLHTYANPQDGFGVLYRDRDGLLWVGGYDGTISQLDTVDGRESVEVRMLLPLLDDGQPTMRKDPFDFQLNCYTKGRNVRVNFYKDRSAHRAATFKANTATGGDAVPSFTQLDQLGSFCQIQVELTGHFQTFRLNNYAITYRPRPELATYRDTGYVHTPKKEFEWVHEIFIGVKPSNEELGSELTDQYVSVSVYFDGALFQISDPIQLTKDTTEYRVPLNRGAAGRMFRAVVSSIPPPARAEDTPRVSAYEFQFLDQINGDLSEVNMETGATVGFNVVTGGTPEDETGVTRLAEALPFDCYYVEWKFRNSGKASQKPFLRVDFP